MASSRNWASGGDPGEQNGISERNDNAAEHAPKPAHCRPGTAGTAAGGVLSLAHGNATYPLASPQTTARRGERFLVLILLIWGRAGEALTQVCECHREKPGHVHLGDPYRLANLGLGHVPVKPHRQDALLTFG